MKKYTLAPQAEQDLLDIFLTGLEHWGLAQAEQYAEELHDCFNLLAEQPGMGITRTELQGNPQSFVKGSHVIFYRPTDGMIEIATVLHQTMDIQTRLSAEK